MSQDFTTTRTQGIADQGGADVAAMSDVAKTRQAAVEANAQGNLQAAQGKGQMRPSLNEQAAEAILNKFRDPGQQRKVKMGELAQRIAEMEKQAKLAHDTTGNLVASNTYLQVANILKSRLHALQSEDVGAQPASADPEHIDRMTPAVGPTTRQAMETR